MGAEESNPVLIERGFTVSYQASLRSRLNDRFSDLQILDLLFVFANDYKFEVTLKVTWITSWVDAISRILSELEQP